MASTSVASRSRRASSGSALGLQSALNGYSDGLPSILERHYDDRESDSPAPIVKHREIRFRDLINDSGEAPGTVSDGE